MTPVRSAGRSVGAAVAALLLAAASSTASAQRVERVGQGDPVLDRRIDALIAGDYTVLTGTRLVARTDTLRGTIVVADATLRIEGVILGDLVALGANVFLRPPGTISGSVLNVAGGFYPSELAAVGGPIVSAPNAPYRIEQTAEVVRVVGLDRRPRFVAEGFRGVFLPSYDRVDGLTLPVGAALLLPRAGAFEPRLRGRLEYRTARQRPTGGLELAAERQPLRLAAGVERTTLTNEEWIRPRWNNSLAYLFAGNDYYDHYEADRAYVEAVTGRVGGGPAPVEIGLRVQAEDARSLPPSDPWSLFGGEETRPNRPVDEGRILSAVVHAAGALSGTTAIVAAGARIELGRARMPLTATTTVIPAGGFGRFEVWADLALAGFLDHTLEIDANARGPLPGTDQLPRQRWSHVGGDRTLYTYPIAAFPGDRLVHVHTKYAIPIAGVRLPLLGPPTFDLVHVAAMAWSHGERPGLEQNVGAGARAGFLFVRYMINPLDTGESAFAVGLTLPGRARPWEDR